MFHNIGRWRLVLRAPPEDRLSRSTDVINKTTFFNTVLCVRLVPTSLKAIHDAQREALPRQMYLLHGQFFPSHQQIGLMQDV